MLNIETIQNLMLNNETIQNLMLNIETIQNQNWNKKRISPLYYIAVDQSEQAQYNKASLFSRIPPAAPLETVET
jgi:hypothetical protein